MRKIDLTGKRFGRLTVVKQLDGHRQPNGAVIIETRINGNVERYKGIRWEISSIK